MGEDSHELIDQDDGGGGFRYRLKAVTKNGKGAAEYDFLNRRPEAPSKLERLNLNGSRIDKSVVIRDRNGSPVAKHCRIETADGKKLWWEPKGIDIALLPLYGCDELPEETNSVVFLVEGEQKRDILQQHGFAALSLPGSNYVGSYEALECLGPYRVVLWPDADPNGASQTLMHRHGQILSEMGIAVLGTIYWVEYRNGDVYDLWLHCNKDSDSFKAAVTDQLEKLVPWTKIEPPEPLGEAAYYGTLGELTKLLSDPIDTEASRDNILGHLLVAAGTWLGDFWWTDLAARQDGLLYLGVVGDTSTGRKGTGLGRALEFLTLVEPEFNNLRWTALASGEGFRNGDMPDLVHRHGRVIFPPRKDNRMLFTIEEFRALAASMKRENSTVSSAIRANWDHENVAVRKADSHRQDLHNHAGIIVHSTELELKDCLEISMFTNGFANRFLWWHVDRQGVASDAKSVKALGKKLDEFLKTWRGIQDIVRAEPQELKLSAEAKKYWADLYVTDIAHPRAKGTLMGSLWARVAPQIMRVAVVYATLDLSKTIEVVHIKAGEEIWRYSWDSCKYIFRWLNDGDGLTGWKEKRGPGRPAHDPEARLIRTLQGFGYPPTPKELFEKLKTTKWDKPFFDKILDDVVRKGRVKLVKTNRGASGKENSYAVQRIFFQK